jgi:hypothetical protein
MGITGMLSGEFSTGMNGPKLAAHRRHPGGVHQPALRHFVYRYSPASPVAGAAVLRKSRKSHQTQATDLIAIF